jgi:hypothetical protein
MYELTARKLFDDKTLQKHQEHLLCLKLKLEDRDKKREEQRKKEAEEKAEKDKLNLSATSQTSTDTTVTNNKTTTKIAKKPRNWLKMIFAPLMFIGCATGLYFLIRNRKHFI